MLGLMKFKKLFWKSLMNMTNSTNLIMSLLLVLRREKSSE